jgi:hypothetical protein
MIDEKITFEMFGYTSDTLAYRSHKRVWRICDICGDGRDIEYGTHRNICHKCRMATKETRDKISKNHADMSEAMMATNNPMYGKHHTDETKNKIRNSIPDNSGEKHPMYGKHLSVKTRQKISKSCLGQTASEETIRKMSIAQSGENHPMYGKQHSEESKRKMSATQQNITYDEWESFAKDNPYCPMFNESCRESNRDKYDRQCFICGLSEKDNITSTGKKHKLSVHHVDMQKQQGCEGHAWKLIPVCMHCHMKLHNVRMAACIEYILEKEGL